MNKDFEKYIGKRVWCKSEELAKEFLRLAHDNGWKWVTGDSLLERTNWEVCENYTYYHVGENKKILYSSTELLRTNEFIEYEPLCVDKAVSQEETKEQTLKVLPQEYNNILDLITGKIDDIIGYLKSANHDTDTINYWRNRKETLTALYEKLKGQMEK